MLERCMRDSPGPTQYVNDGIGVFEQFISLAVSGDTTESEREGDALTED